MLGTRYEVYGEIASGGMATVQYGRLIGPRGFTRPVAIKQLHPHFAKEPEFVSMFIDEARLSARLVHANIIPTLDVVETPGLGLVMEYVHGETLWTLLRLAGAQGKHVPVRVATALIASVLHGLHAAHETRNEQGLSLGIVHRDVSPQNILVGADGVPRVLDFGIAKAIGRLRSTPSGEIKGKLAYIAPEQLCGTEVDRRADVYGASAVLWETLSGHALFDGPNESAIVHRVLHEVVVAPSRHRSEVPAGLDAIVLRGLSRDAAARFATAREMASLVERDVGLASQSEVSDWLHDIAGHVLAERARMLASMQEQGRMLAPQALSGTLGGTRRIEPDALADGPSPKVLMDSHALARPTRFARLTRLSLLGLALVSGLVWAYARVSQGSSSVGPLSTDVLPPIAARAAAAEPDAPASLEPSTQRSERAAPTEPPVERPERAALSEPPQAALTTASVEAAAPVAAPVRGWRSKAAERRKAAAALAAAGAPAKPSAHRKCSPYYYIDAMGIRRPKPECL